MEELLEIYLNQFKKLKRGFNPGFGRAPHKPILLLSILRLVTEGKIFHNRIEISSDLVLTYKDLFQKFVVTGHIDNFALPFYHMGNEPFYRLVPRIGMVNELRKQKSIKSLSKLTDVIAYAEIDKNLFTLMEDNSSRLILREFLLQEYFERSVAVQEETGNNVESRIENDILSESPAEYSAKLKQLETVLDKDSFEEEVFIRGGVFKKTVPRIYDYSCCVSGLTVSTSYNIQMVDACHIVPFSVNQDDTIHNGISLSPNIHRAFDRGLLTINDDYVVRLSPAISRHQSSKELIELDGRQIKLPNNEKYLPSLEALEWHRKEVFLF